MKIGRLPRAIYDYSKSVNMTKHDLRVLLCIGEEMWIGTDTVSLAIMTDRRIVIPSLRKLKNRHYIKVSRAENPSQGITRMYSITQKGRDTVRKFINTLN